MSHLTWTQVLLIACLVLSAMGFGAWIGQHEEKQRHRQPIRYWRV